MSGTGIVVAAVSGIAIVFVTAVITTLVVIAKIFKHAFSAIWR